VLYYARSDMTEPARFTELYAWLRNWRILNQALKNKRISRIIAYLAENQKELGEQAMPKGQISFNVSGATAITPDIRRFEDPLSFD